VKKLDVAPFTAIQEFEIKTKISSQVVPSVGSLPPKTPELVKKHSEK
jgi:hypothetical protein